MVAIDDDILSLERKREDAIRPKREALEWIDTRWDNDLNNWRLHI